jgi:hypothetical protein
LGDQDFVGVVGCNFDGAFFDSWGGVGVGADVFAVFD